jgi:hypothetical protein
VQVAVSVIDVPTPGVVLFDDSAHEGGVGPGVENQLRMKLAIASMSLDERLEGGNSGFINGAVSIAVSIAVGLPAPFQILLTLTLADAPA